MKIINLVEINEKISRKTGDNVITQVCREIKQNLSPEYLFVRYMGPKFVIVFTGIQAEDTEDFVKDLKAKIEKLPQALLSKAFRGELVDQLPSDGSAENLLKEIEQFKRSTKKK